MTLLTSIVLFLGQLVGGNFTYTVEKGESLTSLSARFGVDVRVLAEANGLKSTAKLIPGQQLNVDNRHLVPDLGDVNLLVNVPQRMLFYRANGQLIGYPIAAGRPTWRTNLGDFKVIQLEENPTWDVPLSIQEEMRREGKPVLTCVPPSPENPLGEFWIGLSLPGIGIHGTNAPASIYGLVTHGCIRLHPDNIRELFPKVDVGTRGRISYQPVLAARIGDQVYVEVHRDAYKMGLDPLEEVLRAAEKGGFADMLDLQRVREAIRRQDGIARDVTRTRER
jgi:L,D-transpeptidase ErfK/SrfK